MVFLLPKRVFHKILAFESDSKNGEEEPKKKSSCEQHDEKRWEKHETQPQKKEGKQAEMSENDKMIECVLETFSKAVQDGVPFAQESLPQNIGL
mmetsp:Transcript_19631/g.25388  ORF Transcript_19631/g.25388 Transcript_19631/m.25388 type:complete len:94 (-) Transcript_19631:78-359(-)